MGHYGTRSGSSVCSRRSGSGSTSYGNLDSINGYHQFTSELFHLTPFFPRAVLRQAQLVYRVSSADDRHCHLATICSLVVSEKMPNRAGTEDAAHPGTQPFYSWDATKGSTPQKDIAALELMARTIKQPGKIQDSGLFLGVDLHSGRVRACSKNCKAYLLMGEQEVLGHPLGSLFKYLTQLHDGYAARRILIVCGGADVKRANWPRF
eukprot:907707-Rhodomonas_salina.1